MRSLIFDKSGNAISRVNTNYENNIPINFQIVHESVYCEENVLVEENAVKFHVFTFEK